MSLDYLDKSKDFDQKVAPKFNDNSSSGEHEHMAPNFMVIHLQQLFYFGFYYFLIILHTSPRHGCTIESDGISKGIWIYPLGTMNL